MIDLRTRTKKFSLLIINIVAQLPNKMAAQVIGKQLLRSATSVGANYREALRARSKEEYTSKANVALQELDESSYWLELLQESGIHTGEQAAKAAKETEELIAIFVTIIKKAKQKK